MKRRFSLFALLLALLLALSACSGQPSSQPQQPLTTLQELQELLTRDYIVGYLWYCDGLPEQGELTEDEYLPVDPVGGYATLADLQQLVEKTYTPACVSALLQNADTLGRPRFVEREGRLYKSSRPVFSRYYWDYDAESVTITEETAENLTFTVTMQNLHTGEMLPLTRTAQKTAEGWRLAEVGIPAAEADLTTAAAEETRAIAEKFVAALVENNIETIAACAGEAPETYQNWRGMSIPTAEITETLEEYDGCGRYRVHMAVENAFGVFAKGEEDYLLIVQQEQGQESPVICYYEPMEKHKDFMLNAWNEVMNCPVTKYIKAIVHPFSAVCCPYGTAPLFNLITDDEYKFAFDQAAEKGIAIEINMGEFYNRTEQEIPNLPVVRMFRIAKDCGCKFVFGSDSHGIGGHKDYVEHGEFVTNMLGITEDDIANYAK